MAPCRLALDVGNTRLKWGLLDGIGRVVASHATAIDDRGAWDEALDRLAPGGLDGVAIASVNPPAADRLGTLLIDRGAPAIRWFRSAADVPVRHLLEAPDRTGADRALSVLAAIDRVGRSGPGIVLQCGTAITVERIGPDGTWHGGAIAIGPGLASRALHSGTAQLPEVASLPSGDPPQAWGSSTLPALTAGIVWGAAGAVRELIARQSEGLDPPPWILWTGGDAHVLARLVLGGDARIEPDLVLLGLAIAAFGDREGRAIDSAGTGR